MALRLRRDVQKASYYVWFLGAEEAKGLRGPRVINSVLPYLIDRSRTQEPLKVTLQVSHKGIKIVQGSSKHLIPHSAITSSTQTDDIVACVLLLYNPATKCPLHVHAYRCDSEQTAEALQQQLQILINRPENQKRFEELETRLGIMPPLPANSHSHTKSNEPHSIKSHQSQYQQSKQHTTAQPQTGGSRRHQETSPKRFSSSLGSDTGNSTRESECSEEQASNGSPISRSPPIAMGKPLAPVNNELFDSLAAELRAKLNGNGPPLLLPPRDYDTVHRSKGNLTAIELRRCRNSLIVGATTPPTAVKAAKQVSSRGSSGIGSDLAPSPERQDLNSSSDDEHWSNENDNSVIALKPSQIAMERSLPTIQHHPPLLRKSAAHIPEDSYLRDLPAKPYSPRQQPSNPPAVASKIFAKPIERETRGKSHETWAAKEDEIKPKIVRPIDYDAKFNRLIQAEQKPEPQQLKARPLLKESPPPVQELTSTKQREIEKYNELNRLKKLSLEREIPVETRYKHHKLHDTADDYDDRSERSLERERDREREPISSSGGYRKENLTDKQKFMEYTTKKQQMQREPIKPAGYVSEEAHRYGARHRYVDPADLPFEQPMAPNKYAAIHRHMPAERSPERPELGQRTVERTRERRASPRRDSRERERVMERERERVHDRERLQERERDRERERERERPRERDRDRAHEPDSSYSRSKERNPYREPESLPYIQSMEKMMKSKAMRYKSYEAPIEPLPVDDIPPSQHTKLSQRKSYNKHDDGIDMKVERVERDYNYNRSGRGGSDYPVAPPAAVPINGNVATKERFKEAKDKFRAMERTGSRFDLADERDGMIPPDYKPRRRGSIEPIEPMRPRVAYEEWSDEDPPVPASRSRSRSRDDWEEVPRSTNNNNKSHHSHNGGTAVDYSRRESSQKRHEPRREHSHDGYRPAYDIRSGQAASPAPPGHPQQRYHREEPPREYIRERSERDRNYSPDRRSRSELETRPPIEYTGGSRTMEKQRMRDPHHQTDSYPNSGPSSNVSGPTATGSSKGISNMPKGYRHSYAEPVFARNAGRVGLAAVNPY